jgi:hypothetical protein
MDQMEEKEVTISREFDYSNSIPENKPILLLVQYCDSCYNQLMKMCEEEAKRNERIKYEYQAYQYKKSYGLDYLISITGKNYLRIDCKNYESFAETVNSGNLDNIKSMTVSLELSFDRGKSGNLKRHENEFKISFEPYKIIFTRKSNYPDTEMDQIENVINEILKKMKVQNTIFCTK